MRKKVTFSLFFLAGLLFYGGHSFSSPLPRVERYVSPFTEEPLGAYPWAVRVTSVFRCSGFLVSNRHVMTSAHCIPKNESYFRDLTIHFLNDVAQFNIRGKRFISNPNADLYKVDNQDIAIIEMENDVDIKPPILNTDEFGCKELRSINMKGLGYGVGTALKSVDLSWSVCNQRYVFLLNYQGYVNHGNSGGALFFHKDENTYVTGIAEGGILKPYGNIFFVPLSNNAGFINRYIEFDSILTDGSGDTTYSKSAISKNIQDWTLIPHSTAATTETDSTVTSAAASVNISKIPLLSLLTLFMYMMSVATY